MFVEMKFWLNLGFVREVEQLPAIAQIAEACGFEGVTVPHRFIMPTLVETKYPYTPDGSMFWPIDTPFPEPWVTIGAIAASTRRIRLVSNTYVMGLQDPFTVARVVATASLLSSGRTVCGVSAGWLKEEFDIAGVDFKSRGARLTEMIEVVRKLWTGQPVSHEGKFFRFPEVILSPAPKESIPIWCGGASKAALRRTANHCQGWLGLWYTPDRAATAAEAILRHRKESKRADEPLEVLIGLLGTPDPETLERLESAGVSGIVATPWQTENPAIAPLSAKESALMKYSERWIRP